MKIATTLLVIFASISLGLAQKTLRHTVHFDSDKSEITASEQQQLTAFLQSIDTSKQLLFKLDGHTDSDGSDEYNQQLSARRVSSVAQFLLDHQVDLMKIQSKYFGESVPLSDNSKDEGKRDNRRVEIQVINTSIDVGETCGTRQADSKPDCTDDTTLIFPQGTEVTMNLCDYHSIKDCFEFIEYNTGESVRNSELTTQTADGTPLISGGMFEVKMCKDVEIEVNIPRRTNPCDSVNEFKLWTANSAGAWERITGDIQNIRRGSQNFLRTVVKGTTKINMDALPLTPPPKVIVKVPRKYTIVKAKLSSDTPVQLILPFETKSRKTKFTAVCMCSEPLLYLEVQHRNGEIDTIHFEQLNEFEKHEAFGRCRRNEVEKRILFFKVRKKAIYRKYTIRKSDFEKEV